MANPPHPPPPGPIMEPDLRALEVAVDRFMFPISKRDMMARIPDGETVLVRGRNVELRLLIRDLQDDVFESADEFRFALERQYAEVWLAAEETRGSVVGDGAVPDEDYPAVARSELNALRPDEAR